MKLKKNLVLSDFLQSVQRCRGQVWFVTDEGDRLNLKSVLSEYLFLSAAISTSLIAQGHVQLVHPEDCGLLRDYWEE